MTTPLWATPERQTQLAQLFVQTGNRCLHGHEVCPEPLHYVYIVPAPERVVARTREIECRDGNDRLLYNHDGSVATRYSYKHVWFENWLDDDGEWYKCEVAVVARLYDVLSERLIEGWKADDIDARKYERGRFQLVLHNLPERGPERGRWSAISRTIFHDNQPDWYIESFGVSGLTFRPFAEVRLANSSVRLQVDISESLKKVSKNARRKAQRYGNILSPVAARDARDLCAAAVKAYRAE